MLGSNIVEKKKAWKRKRLGTSAHLLTWIGPNNMTRREKSTACNLVRPLRSTCMSRSEQILIDRKSLSRDPNTHESQLYAQLAHSIVNFLGLNSPQELAEFGLNGISDLVDLISRVCSRSANIILLLMDIQFTTNTFTISTSTLAPLGSCVSPAVALINHSCDPNAVVVFPRATEAANRDEPLMQVIALKNISVDDEVCRLCLFFPFSGLRHTQILTAYIDTTLPRDLRQRHLRETYHFTCGCNLCTPPSGVPVDWREAMWCPKKCGGICPLPTERSCLAEDTSFLNYMLRECVRKQFNTLFKVPGSCKRYRCRS